MRRAVNLIDSGTWEQTLQAGTITLAAADRHRRRIALADDAGQGFLLDLPRAMQMRDGDGLELESGGIIRVVAALEDVVDIHCPNALALARAAWHVGNRHVPVQFTSTGGLRIAADHVLAGMLDGMGLRTARLRAPFQPEPGAYDPHGLMDSPPPLVRRA